MTETSETRRPSKPKPEPLAPGLYIVATPIGNLRDITLRALEVLAGADAIACEDTRTTGRLLKAHGIETAMTSYHEHSAERVRPALLARIAGGASVALVCDAGTPLISDPGYKLARACIEAGLAVTAVPGPSAPLTALLVSGLPSDRFTFVGFPPPRSGPRRRTYEALAATPHTLVFFESARRLAASLADMAAALGPRQAAVARELTKLHEEVRRGPLAELAAHYRDAGAPKGEVVVVVGPPADERDMLTLDSETVDRMLREALAEMSVRDAAARVAAATGLRRHEMYQRALVLAGRCDGADR